WLPGAAALASQVTLRCHQRTTCLNRKRRSAAFELPAGLRLQPAKARLPIAVDDLSQHGVRFGLLAGLLEVLGAVPEKLGVGRLGLEGRFEGQSSEVVVALLTEPLPQSLPGAGFVWLHPDRRRQIIPGQLAG